MTENNLDNLLNLVKTSLLGVDQGTLENIVNSLIEACNTGRSVFVMGNGGSAATCAHFVCDLRYAERVTKRFRVISLNDNTPLLTALANDLGYAEVYQKQLEQLLEPKDIVIVISVSGDSENIVKAANFAHDNGAVTIGFTGSNGGKVLAALDHSIVVSSNSFPVVESVHGVLTQLIAAVLRKNISAHNTK
ncbi:MAG: SIS domain-containing protein [Deltaproteobacteria bacterium]|nr:SIS domain-containing protein [Deltaproteobacteria bacterium]